MIRFGTFCSSTKIVVVVAWLVVTAAHGAPRVKMVITNPLRIARVEMVEVSMAEIAKKLDGETNVVVTDADGREVASQKTYDGKLIFRAGVGGKGHSVYYAAVGTPSAHDTLVAGRLFVERQDEFGWENDRVAYRVYGHGAAVGYDLFNKSTSDLMLDYWYASEQNQEMRSVCRQLRERGYEDLADRVYNAYCYHIDHGKGMDCYTVGPTLGGGANALLEADGTLCMPQCYESFEILDYGPLRFTVRFTYPMQNYEGMDVREMRLISLDAGNHFNRVSVRYEGLEKDVKMASGTVVHKDNPSAYVLSPDNGYIGYEDLGDAGVYNPKYRDELAGQMGRIYIGLLYPDRNITTTYQARENGIASGHILAVCTYKPNTDYTYYFGSGWSRNAETGLTDLTAWEALLSQTAAAVRNPLKVSLQRK